MRHTPYQGRRDGHRIHKPCAGATDVETAASQTEAMLNEGSGGGLGLVGCSGRDDHHIDLAGRQLRCLDRLLSGFGAKFGGGLARGDTSAFDDSGSFQNPRLRHIKPSGQFGVGDAPVGKGGSGAPNVCKRAHQMLLLLGRQLAATPPR